MKFVKLSTLALAMGLFVASCGNSEAPETEETMETTETEMMAPEAAPVDSMAPATEAPATEMPAEEAAH